MFDLIYADPPWHYENTSNEGAAEKHYKTMDNEDIARLPVSLLYASSVVMLLWATTPLLPEAFHVLKRWGCQYKTTITWIKSRHLGVGYWFRGQTEHLLLGVHGYVKPTRTAIPNVIFAPSVIHSMKPPRAVHIIEEVWPDARKLELFATQRRPGWVSLGDVITGNDIKDDIIQLAREERLRDAKQNSHKKLPVS